MNLPIRCKCGSFQGQASSISKSKCKRVICMCNDCQAYTHFLGISKEALDENGGTEIFPVHPANLSFTQGIENLKCVRLSSDGMMRWYAGCCKTPIANTMNSSQLPFAMLVNTILDTSNLGPIAYRINAKYGYGNIPKGASQNAPLQFTLSTIWFLLVGRIKKKQTPSPFFNPEGRPVIKPQVLSDTQYEELIKLCGKPL